MGVGNYWRALEHEHMTGWYVELYIIEMHNSLSRKKPSYIHSVLYICSENLVVHLGF